jgi:Transposase IS4
MPPKSPVSPREWFIRTPAGEMLRPDGDRGLRSPLDYFLLMMPPSQLSEMAQLTNIQLRKSGSQKVAKIQGELLRFIGVLLLSTRFEFGSRASLWSTVGSKYIPAASFGKTGMDRSRFETLWSCLTFSEQPVTRPQEMSSERYRWMRVDDFVHRFNEHRRLQFSPSHRICVDESISRWYGQGGSWINHGLPHCVAIDRKPENGAEIQSAACGRSAIMLSLKLVTSIEYETGKRLLPHGTEIVKELVLPWAHSDRVVCADSYFASVATAEELLRLGLRFIGVVKTATTRYPMKSLSGLEMHNRGESRGLVSKNCAGKPEFLAFVWMDREGRYFISTASSLEPGLPYSRMRGRQSDDAPDADPTLTELLVSQPAAAEVYYDTCAQIERHNRCRQDDLMLERKLVTSSWSMRLNMSILGIVIVDSWLAWRGCKGSANGIQKREFYVALAEELTDNSFDCIGRRERQCVADE